MPRKTKTPVAEGYFDVDKEMLWYVRANDSLTFYKPVERKVKTSDSYIVMMDRDGNELEKFEFYDDIVDKHPSMHKSGIKSVVRGMGTTAYGYKWKKVLKTEYEEQISETSI
jgi:hypothetical protein